MATAVVKVPGVGAAAAAPAGDGDEKRGSATAVATGGRPPAAAAAATGSDEVIATVGVRPPRESLLQYAAPELVDDSDKKATALLKKKAAGKKAVVQDVLNAILPPREYLATDPSDPERQKQIRLIQRVTATPSSRDEVINLQMRLDERLQERQARENGICPVREELYSQTFDELIRQVTIESPERGLLLLRVRDEVRMTLQAYQTLYQSSITFGMRKTLQAEQGSSSFQAKIEALEGDKKKLQAVVQDNRALYDAIEKRISEQRAADEKKMQEEKDFLQFQRQHLESFIKNTGTG